MNEISVKINLENKHCLVIGNGNVGKRKIRKLKANGAIVDVDNPTIKLEDYFLIVLATDDYELHYNLKKQLKNSRVLINDCQTSNNCGVTFLDSFNYLDYELTVSNKNDHNRRAKFKNKLLKLLKDNNVS